jgi:hypothetical protein
MAHSKRERDETEQSRAARIVRDELKKLGWTKMELKRRRKGDPAKVELTRLLRQRTAVSLKWIAENLEMGTWAHVQTGFITKRGKTVSLLSYDAVSLARAFLGCKPLEPRSSASGGRLSSRCRHHGSASETLQNRFAHDEKPAQETTDK